MNGRRYSVLLLLCFAFLSQAAFAASPNVVISQVYGGGGNSGATLKNDFIELFNRGTAPVDLTGWSVQYASSTGTSWGVTPLSGTIAPGQYYLVQQAAGSGGSFSLPAPDATGGTFMAAGAGKVALVSNSTRLTGSCPTASVVDFVGFGSTANCFEGSDGTATLSNTTAAIRANAGCLDTDDNFTDFTIGAPAPRNTAAAFNACPIINAPPSITAPANPAATVLQGSGPISVSLGGTDDGGIYDWSASGGAGITSVAVSAGQGTAAVTYTVSIDPGFSGTASFTAMLADSVNAPVSRAINIAVTPLVANDPPTISPFANPVATVDQDAAPFIVNVSGFDEDGSYNWSATTGTGVASAAITAGQGTPNATFTVTLQPGFSGTATFTVRLSDNVNPNVTHPVTIAVTPAPPPPLDHLVISQIYGGGGNSGAPYRNDFIELYNPTTVEMAVFGWSVQYASSTGSSWQVQPIGGVIRPGEYYLIALAAGSNASAPALPLANINGGINMSASSGKVALVSSGDALGGVCPVGGATVVDFVGFGSANCREGLATASGGSNSRSLFRKNGGFTDTNNNGADFETGAPNPRRTTAVGELGPYVLSVDPRNGSTIAPRDANITVTFTEPVTVTGAWFDISCASTGLHNDATFGTAGNSWIIVPNVTFLPGEQCTGTVYRNFVHDVDLDDAGPADDTLTADYVWTFTIATGDAPAYSSDVHLTMGMPAAASLDTPNAYLMVKPELALSYNRDRGTPNWVSWHLADEWVGSLSRNDTFRADPAVPADWYRVLGTDYFSSGFDRGHMVPNADRDPATSIPINQATFLMTNIIPQAPDNNQGPWADMENYLRTLLPANELYIVAGGAGTGGTGSSGFATTIAGGNIAVPASTWKVALVLPKESGDDVGRVTPGMRTIAVVMPNVQGIRNHDWQSYIVSVDAVESLTGYDFFSAVADPIETSIEAGINGANPPAVANQRVSVTEDVAAAIVLNAIAATGSPLTYTIVGGPSNGTLSGTGASLTYTPAADYSGSDSFTYQVTEGTLTSALATVTLDIAPVNDAPVIVSVAGPAAALTAGSTASLSFQYGDVDPGDTHSALFSWDDGSSTPVACAAGVCTASHAFAGAGVFSVALTLIDSAGASAAARFESVIVIDAGAGFATGGGWIASPSAGAGTFGFNAKYLKDRALPTGNTEFSTPGLEFLSSSYEWLVVAGANVQVRGTGAVNGAGGYAFILSATDGDVAGNGIDRFRIRIWNATTGVVFYDNVPGASDDIDTASPQQLGGGNITVHSR